MLLGHWKSEFRTEGPYARVLNSEFRFLISIGLQRVRLLPL